MTPKPTPGSEEALRQFLDVLARLIAQHYRRQPAAEPRAKASAMPTATTPAKSRRKPNR